MSEDRAEIGESAKSSDTSTASEISVQKRPAIERPDDSLCEAALLYHMVPKPGKLSVTPTKALRTQQQLALAYSPGVAYPCLAIQADPASARKYTARGNLVGVITNGTAVLGLGDIGPLASKPVMEGKACLFKQFAGVDVFDIELRERDPARLVEIICALEPTLGGINLEDIRAPDCFYIEEQLSRRLEIPVFHDDQHGTAIVATAALLNALELAGKRLGDVRIAISGAGAAAIACADAFVRAGAKADSIVMVDSAGVIHHDRRDLTSIKSRFARVTDARSLGDAVRDSDVFLGCSSGSVLKAHMVATMAHNPVLLALANPEPEIRPEVALRVRPDCIIATGRSDYPNQVNNLLCFPYIFRGALDCGATAISPEMKEACVREIAALAREPVPAELMSDLGRTLHFGREYFVPSPFDWRLLPRLAAAVAQAAHASGVARTPIGDLDAYKASLSDLRTEMSG